ncbi:MAG: nucleotidyltransferase domain-containing protein [Candidatus Riflebacteria bacterium]|nr:nucleotidyltransferase domain-containing protein [Candidatus Riflebacteria bacterium]
MVPQQAIKRYAREVARAFQPWRIVLFGSYAHGSATADSDVDVLVILPYQGSSVRKALEIMETIRPGFPVDLLVRSPEEVDRRLAQEDFFLREVTERGKVLYEAPHP